MTKHSLTYEQLLQALDRWVTFAQAIKSANSQLNNESNSREELKPDKLIKSSMGELSSLAKLLNADKAKAIPNQDKESLSYKLIKWKVDKYKNKILEILDMNSEVFETYVEPGVDGGNGSIINVNKIVCTNLPVIFKDLSLIANFVMCSKEQ